MGLPKKFVGTTDGEFEADFAASHVNRTFDSGMNRFQDGDVQFAANDRTKDSPGKTESTK